MIDTGRTIASVAAEINVNPSLLAKWVRAERIAMGPTGTVPLSPDERAELERLRKENRELRLDNAFLGKASAYFAARQPPMSASR